MVPLLYSYHIGVIYTIHLKIVHLDNFRPFTVNQVTGSRQHQIELIHKYILLKSIRPIVLYALQPCFTCLFQLSAPLYRSQRRDYSPHRKHFTNQYKTTTHLPNIELSTLLLYQTQLIIYYQQNIFFNVQGKEQLMGFYPPQLPKRLCMSYVKIYTIQK